MSAVISGVGTSSFGKQQKTASDLAVEAIDEALQDAGVDRREIERVFVGSVFGGPGFGHRALRAAGISGVPVLTIENACASGTTAMHLARDAIRDGHARTTLAVGIEKMTDRIKGAIPPETDDEEGLSAMPLPGMYAMTADRYMHLHGVTLEDLAQISVINHHNAMENPRAQYRGEYTIDEVLASRPIADPLTLLQCSPISDGAAAAVLQHEEAAAHGAVRIRSSVMHSGGAWPGSGTNVWNFDLVDGTARAAYAAAGISVADIDVVELHDAFTIGELMSIEGMGLAPVGRAHHLVRDGDIARGGRIPVNPSGGLLSRGHPLGATGLAQIAEIYWQLTDRAAGRQVPAAAIGVVETMGANVCGLSGNGCVVAVLEGPS